MQYRFHCVFISQIIVITPIQKPQTLVEILQVTKGIQEQLEPFHKPFGCTKLLKFWIFLTCLGLCLRALSVFFGVLLLLVFDIPIWRFREGLEKNLFLHEEIFHWYCCSWHSEFNRQIKKTCSCIRKSVKVAMWKGGDWPSAFQIDSNFLPRATPTAQNAFCWEIIQHLIGRECLNIEQACHT